MFKSLHTSPSITRRVAERIASFSSVNHSYFFQSMQSTKSNNNNNKKSFFSNVNSFNIKTNRLHSELNTGKIYFSFSQFIEHLERIRFTTVYTLLYFSVYTLVQDLLSFLVVVDCMVAHAVVLIKFVQLGNSC